jgi:hypothetical protein
MSTPCQATPMYEQKPQSIKATENIRINNRGIASPTMRFHTFATQNYIDPRKGYHIPDLLDCKERQQRQPMPYYCTYFVKGMISQCPMYNAKFEGMDSRSCIMHHVNVQSKKYSENWGTLRRESD